MSTRGCYRFTDGHNQGPFTVYKHSDNYPYGEHGGIAAIAKAIPYAWDLPRFEADEFAAAFVAAHKAAMLDRYGAGRAGGQVRLLNTPAAQTLDHMPGDIEYLYDITERNGELWIKASEIEHPEGWGSDRIEAKLMAEGTLEFMLLHFSDWPKDDAAE